MIYAIAMPLITAACGGYVKFGYAKNVQSRLSELQVGCPLGLSVWGVVDMDHKDELFIHEAFADARLRGEWFDMVPRVLQFIRLMDEDIADDVKKVRCIAYLRKQMYGGDFDAIAEKISTEARDIALQSEFADIFVVSDGRMARAA